jgi:pimeloyl-ACP methyl ester carboxylesterase
VTTSLLNFLSYFVDYHTQHHFTTNMSKPHIVLVPGAWHAPFYMDTLVSKLQDLGYTIHARQMPSVGNPSPPTDLTQDIATLRSLVSDAIGSANNDVVVICHSWGGIVTGSGLVGLSKTERLAEGKSGGVVKTGYIAALIVPEGVSLMDAGGDRQPEWFDIQVKKKKSPPFLSTPLP